MCSGGQGKSETREKGEESEEGEGEKEKQEEGVEGRKSRGNSRREGEGKMRGRRGKNGSQRRKAEEGGRPGPLLRGLLMTIRYLVLPTHGLGHRASCC